MREIEVKILEINKSAVLKHLKKVGAKKEFSGKVKSIYLDYADRRLMKKGAVVRLRKKGIVSQLTLKTPRKHAKAKVMNETELAIGSVEQMQAVMKELGLKPIRTFEKIRESYVRKGIRYELDKYPGIPWFLEIECQKMADLNRALKELGKKIEDTNSWNTWDLFRFYGKKVPAAPRRLS